MISDWECLAQARGGSDAAWLLLMQRHFARLTALALLIVQRPETAEDIAQDAMVKLYESQLAHHSGTVGGWLTTIVYRQALKTKQRAARHTELEARELVDAAPSPLQRLLASERDRSVTAAVRRLDDDHRATLALRFYGGYSYEEIAALMNVPLGTVKSRIFYAVKMCREFLRKDGLLE